MLISASRRTDIPAFYSRWFFNRLRAGEVKVRNPFNPAQARRVSLRPRDVDCFVFWTKDPAPMMDGLSLLDELAIPYYFQFTLTPYGRQLEQNLRDKADIAATFAALSQRLGRQRVCWRYDPIILNNELDAAWHTRRFAQLCAALCEYTEGVTISFVDQYAKVKTPLVRPIAPAEMARLAAKLAQIAAGYGLAVKACCEQADFSSLGIGRASCIDKALVQRLAHRPIEAGADKNQRKGCGCAASVDIGAYNTCANGCVYCYASHSAQSVAKNRARHCPEGEYLLPGGP